MKYCAHCGAEMEDNASFCQVCGAGVNGGSVQESNTKDASSFGFALLSFFFPLVGLILWIVWKDTSPLKAKSCGKGALFGVIASIVLSILSGILMGILVAATMTGTAEEIQAAMAMPASESDIVSTASAVPEIRDQRARYSFLEQSNRMKYPQ